MRGAEKSPLAPWGVLAVDSWRQHTPTNRGEGYLILVGKFAEGFGGAGNIKLHCAAISNGGDHKLGLRPCVEQPWLIRPFTPAGDILITGQFLTFLLPRSIRAKFAP